MTTTPKAIGGQTHEFRLESEAPLKLYRCTSMSAETNDTFVHLRAYVLAARLPGLGVDDDLTSLSTSELWGVLRFLKRVEGGG